MYEYFACECVSVHHECRVHVHRSQRRALDLLILELRKDVCYPYMLLLYVDVGTSTGAWTAYQWPYLQLKVSFAPPVVINCAQLRVRPWEPLHNPCWEFLFKTGSHVSHNDLKLLILLPTHPKYWDFKYVLLYHYTRLFTAFLFAKHVRYLLETWMWGTVTWGSNSHTGVKSHNSQSLITFHFFM